MPATKRRTLQEIQTFIRKQLPVKLRRDLQYLRIVKEADVECAAYHHLRNFIGESRRWRVLARKHVPRTGHYVDLLIFKDYSPAIALELKWGQTDIGVKDRHSLNGCLKDLGVHKAYWLSALASKKKKRRWTKENDEKGVMHRIIVRLQLPDGKLKKWTAHRKLLRSDMPVGSGRRLTQREANVAV
ncbi:MAG: hypothetical protein ACYDCJ_13750 [Gammaproteobacteria bacterium]